MNIVYLRLFARSAYHTIQTLPMPMWKRCLILTKYSTYVWRRASSHRQYLREACLSSFRGKIGSWACCRTATLHWQEPRRIQYLVQWLFLICSIFCWPVIHTHTHTHTATVKHNQRFLSRCDKLHTNLLDNYYTNRWCTGPSGKRYTR